MKKSKWFPILSASALALSLYSPAASAAPVEELPSLGAWDEDRYGERIDIDQELNRLTNDETFQKEAEKRIKDQAGELNDESADGEENAAASEHFTEDHGTKLFLDRNLAFKEFTLRSIGDNVEIWVANDLAYGPDNPKPADIVTQAQVDKLKAEFDSNIYPVATDFFGTPDTLDGSKSPLPGMVGLPEGYYEGSDKVIMLVDNVQDEGWNDPSYPFFVAGFFWQTLENYTDRNIITIDTNSWETRLESTFFGTTIHELQHLIQADNDGAEETWVNEGMSTFSEFLGGYGHGEGSINFYLDHPENSLVNWDEHGTAATGPETIADYGQVYLFTLYMYDKFGQEFIREIATDGTTQGIASIDKVLEDYGTNKTFTELYQDFMTALTLDDDTVSKDYKFDSIDLRELPVGDGVRGKTVDFEKAKTFEKEGVPAWGGDFKEFDLDRTVRGMKFDGVDFLPLQWDTVANPLDASEQVLHANNGDEADQALIFGATVPADNATLSFEHYYNIEEQWDFAAVQVSTDNGETWKSLENENTRSDVVEEGYPTIKENVPGFTGEKTNWSTETFDLAEYAGQDVLVSFRNLTDWGSNEAGWFVKNIELGSFTADGTSTEPFQSLGQLKGEYVDFTTTFIQTKKNGKQRVFNVDPYNVTEKEALDLQQVLREGNLKMITSYAAAPDQKEAKEFTYEVLYKEDKSKGKGKGNNKK
ncbi:MULTISPECIES: immune inhibitor A domain-containing protein [unclassified Planococcus (in: firmicutes)]|uniref:immune inhibitor A domain-containing protein n=1 Tax=unclassified Planococcus (in: firmicutes) TaxID=2662419 RepID=UPI000C32361A|nr:MULTISPECIES: immune inhibitor A domain-containing protein [unclassified Planococcus (in: firmicutes)]AUD14672.1 peptidase M6 [Planococcus sp. MB-3u-03]PKG44975.1 peptidase M6 [Planococcus sp. Urea-trap-24]PKG87318.1 peptidase M6 [Planococcus sp. Urea-3u-39]PKH42443.1 peptidase M6 [Planococcus sp. MB-3u-09]